MTNIFTRVLYWIAGLFGYSKPNIINTAPKDDRAKTEQIFRGLPYLGDIMDIADKIIADGNVSNLIYREPEMRFDLVFYGSDYIDDVIIKIGDVQVNFWGIDQTTLRMNHTTRWMELSLKAQEELPRAMLKAKNLHDRFIGTLSRIILVPLSKDNTILDSSSDIVDSIGIAIEYELLDETRTFSAYYKNNEIKKKLKGAEITSTNVENAYKEAVASINQDWIDYGSDLRLIGNADPRLTKLNDNLIFVNSKIAEDGKYALMKAVSSAEFKHYMHLLLSHDIYSVSLAGYVQKRVAMDPELDPKGFIRFKPVFNHDSEILAVSAAVVKLNSRIAEDV